MRLGVLWSSRVTITDIKVSLTKGACDSSLRPAVLGCDGSHCMMSIEPAGSHTSQLLPLCVLNITHMCVCCRPLCVGLPFSRMCVCPTGLVLADSSSCSPLLLSKPFVSVRCFCFDAFFLPLHLNFHPAQSGRRFRFSVDARISETDQHYYLNSSAPLFLLSHAGLDLSPWKTPILHVLFFFIPLL